MNISPDSPMKELPDGGISVVYVSVSQYFLLLTLRTDLIYSCRFIFGGGLTTSSVPE